MSKAEAKGASKSLNKTITEIMEFLGDEGERPRWPFQPDELRDFLQQKIGNLSEKWFKKGFNRGHKESHSKLKADGKVPRTLRFTCKRSLSPGQDREIEMESTIKSRSKKSRK